MGDIALPMRKHPGEQVSIPDAVGGGMVQLEQNDIRRRWGTFHFHEETSRRTGQYPRWCGGVGYSWNRMI